MSGLLFLTANDFKVITDNKQTNILINNINGFSLILFYSTQCTYCKTILPIMKRLPGTINGCQFGMINVGRNKDVIRMSQNSITPLTYVPYVILYYNKKPYMRYDGPHDINQIQNFVYEVANSIKRQLETNNIQEVDNQEQTCTIPDYCIARPKKDGVKEKICYINFSEAYDN
tara:strand:- start:110 stop:628 length:519 start_codon:yes stop_codon:yes gene_type:complete